MHFCTDKRPYRKRIMGQPFWFTLCGHWVFYSYVYLGRERNHVTCEECLLLDFQRLAKEQRNAASST
jgi:hypothetical protein